MGYILCTTEKPSVAQEIATAVGATKRCNGFYEGNGYRVTWAVGHLVGLAEPEAYGYMSQEDMYDKEKPENMKIAIEQLPLIPEKFKLIVLPATKDQFEIMKNLMNSNECDYIIDCGDAGNEGHILQWFIRVKAGCKKPVKRFMATSMTQEAIKAAMHNLKNVEDYMGIIKGEFCKKKCDWILGMSMSRCASIIYNAKVDVGRVQSPTLFFVVQRYLEVTRFKPQNYYQLKAEFNENFNAFWLKDTAAFFPQNSKDSFNRLLIKKLADNSASEIQHLGVGKVTLLETKNKYNDRPQLYDITELERDGNIIYGYSADEVLAAAQNLYEKHKITSYPRTDSRYITSDLIPYMKQRVQQIASLEKYKTICMQVLQTNLNIDKKIVDDSKVTDHHAIICTERIQNYDLSLLSDKELNILHLIISRMLVSFSARYDYKETVINVTFQNGFVFSASGKIPVNMGWKYIQNSLNKTGTDNEDKRDSSENEEQFFTNISLNQEVHIKSISVMTKKTTPPKYHTEASLLTAMENAGNVIENGDILKEKGIGTPATRAAIIQSLFKKRYVENLEKGKTKYLIPTKQGMSVIKVLPKELYSPKITADWEREIALIASGDENENDFMNRFTKFINEKINTMKTQKIDNVDFSYEKPTLGNCKWCGSSVYVGKFKDKKDNTDVVSAYCSNKECKFSIRNNDLIYATRTGKKLTLKQMQKLVRGETITANCVSKATVPYKGEFHIVQNDKGYAAIVCELASKKKKSKVGAKKKLANTNRW